MTREQVVALEEVRDLENEMRELPAKDNKKLVADVVIFGLVAAILIMIGGMI